MSSARASYGIDAPGVIVTFFAVFAVGATACLLMLRFNSVWFHLLACVLGLFALAGLGFGIVMLLYAFFGKLRMRDRMLGMVAWQGSEAVLDVGTGRGLLAIGAAHRLSTGRVTGMDIWSAKDLSGNGAENARANAILEGVADKIELRTESIVRTPLPNSSFDVIFSLLCLHNIEGVGEQIRACEEIARLLKPGGRALIADYVPTGDYGKALVNAGLVLESSKAYPGTALALMWMVVASKPDQGF